MCSALSKAMDDASRLALHACYSRPTPHAKHTTSPGDRAKDTAVGAAAQSSTRGRRLHPAGRGRGHGMTPSASPCAVPALPRSCSASGQLRGEIVRRLVPRTLSLALLLVGAACTRQRVLLDQAPEVMIYAVHSPSPPTVGEGEMTLSFVDGSGAPVRVSSLSLKADMTHPGMTPWLADVEALEESQFTLPVSWSMAGDWILQIEAELSDGRRLRRTLPMQVEPAGEPGAG